MTLPKRSALTGELRFAAGTLRCLPWPVARFVLRARWRAVREHDRFSLDSALRPAKMRELISLSAGRKVVAELGTGTAWATIVLALAEPERTIVSYDPELRPSRDRYLALVAPSVRERIEFVEQEGEQGPGSAEAVELLFIDSSHELEPTIAEVAAWRPSLTDDALIVFDDYGNSQYPGVAQAVDQLGVIGQQRATMFAGVLPAARQETTD